MALDADSLVFAPLSEVEPISIPTASIARLDQSTRYWSRGTMVGHGVVWGLVGGLLAGYAIGRSPPLQNDCTDCGALTGMPTVFFGGVGLVTGVTVAASLPRDR